MKVIVMKKGLVVLLSMMLLLFTACASKSDPNAGQSGANQPGSNTSNTNAGNTDTQKEVSGTINLYTSEPQDLVNEMMNDFKSKHPKIDVKIYRSGTGEVISKLEAEAAAGKIQADVLWFADIDYFNKLAQEGKLEEYKSPEAQNLDQRYIYENGKYYEVRQIFNVIGYNTSKIKTAPTSWKDLAGSDFKGKVAIANPNYSGAAFLTLATLVNDSNLGWDYFASLKNNDVKFEQSNGNLSSKLASGEYYGVSVVDFMVRNAKKDGSPVDVVYPKEGSVLVPTPVGILSQSANKEAAKVLVDYFLSMDGQKLFVKQGYIPVKPEAGAPEGAPKPEDIKLFPLDLNFIGKNRDSLKQKFTELFG